MKYRYSRTQLFRKKFDLPKNILNQIYGKYLSLYNYISYDLIDKVPEEVLSTNAKTIINKFGIDRVKALDLDLLVSYRGSSVESILLNDSIDGDLNDYLYSKIEHEFDLSMYTPKMKEQYKDRFIDEPSIEYDFEKGRLSSKDLLKYYSILKDKDIEFGIRKDNQYRLSNFEIKSFFDKYAELFNIINFNGDLFEIIYEFNTIGNEAEEEKYIKYIIEDILFYNAKNYTNEQLREILKFYSLSDLVKNCIDDNNRAKESVVEQLESIPIEFILNSKLDLNLFFNSDVLDVFRCYGIKNLIELDNECNNFLTNNNCEFLRIIEPAYLHYGYSLPDEISFYALDDDGYIRIPTKDELYKIFRNFIVHGPTDWSFKNIKIDYSSFGGEFKKKNKELFLSEEAPEELKNYYYSKSLEPSVIKDHPEYIKYLKDKKLSYYFKFVPIKVDGKISNFYDYLSTIFTYEELMDFISKNTSVILYNSPNMENSEGIVPDFSSEDAKEEFIKKYSLMFKNVMIRQGIPFPKGISASVRKNISDIFLDKDVPEDLKQKFYGRELTAEDIILYKKYLTNIDIEILFKYIPIIVSNKGRSVFNMSTYFKDNFGNDEALKFMLTYYNYLIKLDKFRSLHTFSIDAKDSIDVIKDKLDDNIYEYICRGSILYNIDLPDSFKEKYPYLFLDDKAGKDLQDKFYNRKFTLEDFANNPNLITVFGQTNIAFGFPLEVSWMGKLFNGYDDKKAANKKRLKIISYYYEINDYSFKNVFKEYIIEHEDSIELDKIEYISKVLNKLALSNSSEIKRFKNEIATQILSTDNPMDTLDKVEKIFVKNDIPTVGKVYSCFELLYPDINVFKNDKSISPILQGKSANGKKSVIFSDLIRTSFGSNNRSVKEFIDSIEKGNVIFNKLRDVECTFEELTYEEQQLLITFKDQFLALYNLSFKGKKESFISTGDIYLDLMELVKRFSPDGALDYNLPDRMIYMFCGYAGFNTLDEVKNYLEEKIKNAEKINIERASSGLRLKKGDFIKGINDIKYLRNILQNGSVSKEFLGTCAGSDNTPLDTDVSMILSNDGTNEAKIASTAASSYGSIYLVLKGDERFSLTRTKDETYNIKNDPTKLEVFYTGVCGDTHYGIRTGFASSEIDYIVCSRYDQRIGLEIAINGFYIPVTNEKGDILFTYDDYLEIRKSMQGLSYFGLDSYDFSSNLHSESTEKIFNELESSILEVKEKKNKIYAIIKRCLNEFNLDLKTVSSKDLSPGVVELIDTGSTGRNTNMIGDGDFDFMMKFDNDILSNSALISKIKNRLIELFGMEHKNEVISTGDFRFKNVSLGDDTSVDIDITFTPRTDKISYSTDECLKDRLETLRKQDPIRYRYVLANIIEAKRVLKEAHAYKPNRGEVPQGGLGGIGVETWILLNGGSFIDACNDFLKKSEGKSFSQFKETFHIWDFGENHLSEKKGIYPHDEFVYNNMSEEGYIKMREALERYMELQNSNTYTR